MSVTTPTTRASSRRAKPRRALVAGENALLVARIAKAVEDAGWRVLQAEDDGAAEVLVVAVDGAGEQVRDDGDVRPCVAVLSAALPDLARQLLGAGVEAVLLADDLDTQLAPALAALDAGLVVSARQLVESRDRPILTVREKQVLAMVVLGFSNYEISRKLFVTESTVKSHLSSSFAKLGVRGRSEATALILDSSQGLGTGILSIVGGGNGETIAAPDWDAAAR